MLKTLVRQYLDYTSPIPLRVAVGTYNINGGKHFRSVAFKDVSLQDWLLYDKTDLGRKKNTELVLVMSS